MTQEDIARAVEALDRLRGSDPEGDHIEADKIILDLLPVTVRNAYRDVEARCGTFWYA